MNVFGVMFGYVLFYFFFCLPLTVVFGHVFITYSVPYLGPPGFLFIG